MPQYVFLLYGDESWFDEITPESWEEDMAAHAAFAAAVERAGARILGGAALDRTSTATTLRRPASGEEPLITDGPFAEIKEALGGFYIIETESLDQALELAAGCPTGVLEVRPVLNTDSPPI